MRGHFEENPRDMAALRHDRALHTVKQKTHLKNVPDYIIPKTLKRMATATSGGGGEKKRFKGGRSSQAKRKFERNKADPLKSLKMK